MELIIKHNSLLKTKGSFYKEKKDIKTLPSTIIVMPKKKTYTLSLPFVWSSIFQFHLSTRNKFSIHSILSSSKQQISYKWQKSLNDPSPFFYWIKRSVGYVWWWLKRIRWGCWWVGCGWKRNWWKGALLYYLDLLIYGGSAMNMR